MSVNPFAIFVRNCVGPTQSQPSGRMQVRGDEWTPIDAPDSWMEVGIAVEIGTVAQCQF